MKWRTLEYYQKSKSADWFWAVGLVTIIAAGVSVYFNNVLLAILIVLSAVTLVMFAVRHPKELDVELMEKGIRINKTLYPFSSLESFWIDEDIYPPRLLLKSKSVFSPLIVVMIENVSLEDVEDHLIQKIEMEEMSEPFLQRLLEHLGF